MTPDTIAAALFATLALTLGRAHRLGYRWQHGHLSRRLTPSEVHALPCAEYATLTPSQRVNGVVEHARGARGALVLAALLFGLVACTHLPSAPWRPSCGELVSDASRAVCTANARVDTWAYAGLFNGHVGCWQLTGDPAVGTVFECSDGYAAIARTT